MERLVDSSMLVRQADVRSADKAVALYALSTLKGRGDELILASQNLIEFWAVATRPQSANGLGMTVTQAEQERIRLQTLFTLRSDPAGLYDRWVRLVNDHGVSGKQVHDTRLAAFMIEAGISSILTFNVSDFARFPGIVPVHPANV